jgi:heme exporter protein B
VTFVRHTLAVAGKDVRIEVRGRYGAGTALPFAATVLIAFGLALGPGRTLLQATAPGLLWIAMLFAAVLSFRRAFEAEGEDGALEGLLLAPVDKAAVFLGKAAAVALQLLVLEAAIVLMVSALFDLTFGGDVLVWMAALVLGTIGLSAVGSLFGVLAESPRAREAVFPLLVLPLVTPILLAGVRATTLAIEGLGSQAGSWLGLMLAFDVVFVAAGTLVFEHLMEY